ncbi:aldose 1-epimerase family protein [Occultella gossypii]|uniref:Aldose 1-epimerase family protein n=1 Tax=Occultella gossypii TaxID=2800820 RepID=A0ABS7S7J0_9MICO|nr:aldose 1-epimerase family protein [Occultella gossypii]MBZ2196326.1 aldose 1-epimerase family protein [Occultella gossypii]
MTSLSPTGQQFEIRAGDAVAIITEVGANLRLFRVGQRDVVVPYGVDELPPASNGAVLVPWPNRIRDGRYTWDGQELQLPLTEPERGTALHGLVCWQRWTVLEHTADAVELRLDPAATPGYPFQVSTRIRYTIGTDGLAVTATTANIGPAAAPYGIGFHPWLSPGPGSLDDAELQLDATAWIPTDERLLPTGVAEIPEDLDFREPRRMGRTALDDAFVGALYDDRGLSWLRLRGTDGRLASVWMDESLRTWQMCTGDEVAAPQARRTGLAAEPMTCVADAFRSGERLIRLEPGADHTVRWGLRLD